MGKLMQINPQRVRQHMIRVTLGAMALMAISTPAFAQARVNIQEFERANRVAEALRRVTLQGNTRNPGYYSDWQVKGDRIPLWSQQCLGRRLTPEQFDADQAAATSIVTCIVQDMMRMEIRSAANDEALAIRRLAAWWVTGDPEQYDTNVVSDYTKRVLSVYQPNGPVTAALPTPPQPISIDTTALKATTATLPAPARATPKVEPPPTAAAKPKPAVAAAKPQPTATAAAGTAVAGKTAAGTTVAQSETAAEKPTAASASPSDGPKLIRSNGTDFYDRYMQAGYAASREPDYARALLFFQRALDENQRIPMPQRRSRI